MSRCFMAMAARTFVSFVREAMLTSSSGCRWRRAVAGDPGDMRALLGQRDGDGVAGTPAGAGDQRRRSGKLECWHDRVPDVAG
jgi:hypothetical protein